MLVETGFNKKLSKSQLPTYIQ